VILCQYAHQSSGNWWTYTDTNRVFPIWKAWTVDLVINTGGFEDSLSADLAAELAMVRAGFPSADVIDVITHVVTSVAMAYDFERQFCFANGLPCFDGQAASTAAWGGYNNAIALGLFQDTKHLTANGYASFSQLLWSWMALVSESPSIHLASSASGGRAGISMPGGGLSTNVSLPGGTTLFITNGRIWKITAP
jgi:hypothetical protein